MTALPDGFVAWEGGLCPVPLEQRVQFLLRGCDVPVIHIAAKLRWAHDPQSPKADIIAYRKEPDQ